MVMMSYIPDVIIVAKNKIHYHNLPILTVSKQHRYLCITQSKRWLAATKTHSPVQNCVKPTPRELRFGDKTICAELWER